MNPVSPSWQAMYAGEKYRWFWPPAYDPQQEPPELAFVLSQLNPPPGARILDLACGQGWLTIPLALRGCQVTGFDLSQAMLDRAQEAAVKAGAEIQWLRGDMRQLPDDWTASFDTVTFTLSEFGCFDSEEENQSVLNEAARVLKEGSRFLLDIVVNRDGLVQQGETRSVLEGDGFFVEESGRLDLLSGIQKRVYRWYQDGQLYETQWQINVYTPPQVRQMLEKAGFQVQAVYGDLKGRELSRQSTGMTFLAQKGS